MRGVRRVRCRWRDRVAGQVSRYTVVEIATARRQGVYAGVGEDLQGQPGVLHQLLGHKGLSSLLLVEAGHP